MSTVSLSYKNNNRSLYKNKSEYYLKLIIKQTLECLNSNCISYVPEQNNFSKILIKTDANIVLTTVSNQKSIPYSNSGIQIFFTAGNPKSKRLAEIMARNLKNIYYSPSNVTIHPAEKNLTYIPKNKETYVYPGLGHENSKKDMEWLKENTEEISQNLIMSLTEYFGLPFAPCLKPIIGIAQADADIFSKPNTKSKIIGFITKSQKIKVQGQWENWYIIGKNNDLGYISAKYIDII